VTIELPSGSLVGRDVAVDLSVDLGRGLVLRNPVLVASGTFGYGTEYADVVDIQRLGAICCKGTTLRPRMGNPPPRVTETPAGMLNSIGLQNPGVAGVLEKYAPRWAGWHGSCRTRPRRSAVGSVPVRPVCSSRPSAICPSRRPTRCCRS